MLPNPGFVAKFRDVIAGEEVGRSRPFGAALDIGTGSGIWGIELAKRGWQVTGIDNVQKALDRARERVEQSGVNMQLIKGDVTAIRQTGISTGFRLILDTGTFHDFIPTQQRAMGHGIDAIATPDGIVLLLIWPRRIRPLIRGADRAEIEAAFPNWRSPS